MLMKLNYKTFSRMVLRIILFFVFIEIFLRVGGWASLVVQDKRNKVNFKGAGTYRIICIGDSNTALGGEHSFPSQLDVILNKLDKSRKYEVINKGLPAADSAEIVGNVEQWIDQYEPNMIVSMMGSNDRIGLLNERKSANIFAKLKVSRLFQGVLLKLLNFKSDKDINQLLLERDIALENKLEKKEEVVLERKTVDPEYVKMLMLGLKMLESKDYLKAEILFKSLVSQDLDIIFLDRAYKELGQSLKQQGKTKQLLDVFKYQFERDEYNVFASDTIRELCKGKKAVSEIESFLLGLLENNTDSENMNGLLGSCYAEWGDNLNAAKYMDKVRQLRKNTVNPMSKKNYRELAEILKNHNIKGVFVQYPLLNIENLEIMFRGMDDSYDFALVDNMGIFKEALDPGKYKEYFSDRSLNDRGHCTPKGNYILAENTAKVILNSLK